MVDERKLKDGDADQPILDCIQKAFRYNTVILISSTDDSFNLNAASEG